MLRQKHREFGVQPLLSTNDQPGTRNRKQNSINFHDKHSIFLSFATWARRMFNDLFLPVGYPESVSADYWEYQKWDTLQALCSSLSNTLASRAILETAGVGRAEATVSAATIQWLLRDGTGMLGRILFAKTQGRGLDCNAKQWRLFADIMDDAARCVQLATPIMPQHLHLSLLCVASVGFSIVGVAGGATRASLTQHQAQSFNLADVSAKDSSQETAVNLIALLFSLMLIPILDATASPIFLSWILFVVFASLHVVCNYQACRSVFLPTLNARRLSLVVTSYLDKSSSHSSSPHSPPSQPSPPSSPSTASRGIDENGNFLFLMTPETVALYEDIWLLPWASWQDFECGPAKAWRSVFGAPRSLCMDISMGTAIRPLTTQELDQARKHSANDADRFLMVVLFDAKTNCWHLFVLFSESATSTDQLKACFQLAVLKRVILGKSKFIHEFPMQPLFASTARAHSYERDEQQLQLYQALLACSRYTQQHFDQFVDCAMHRGWVIDRHDIVVESWCTEWKKDNSLIA
eukprot:c11162_g1_i1.p1 GENE.c11162_g1_i1~~c11162_g1_i1.p1  ORF type:complete len:522 (+),score=83.32 c11162_g1_i1:2-1567(+)